MRAGNVHCRKRKRFYLFYIGNQFYRTLVRIKKRIIQTDDYFYKLTVRCFNRDYLIVVPVLVKIDGICCNQGFVG